MILERKHHEKGRISEQYEREKKYLSDLETGKERKKDICVIRVICRIERRMGMSNISESHYITTLPQTANPNKISGTSCTDQKISKNY